MQVRKVFDKIFPTCTAVFDWTIAKNRKRPPKGIICSETCCGICPAHETCRVSCAAKMYLSYKDCPDYKRASDQEL